MSDLSKEQSQAIAELKAENVSIKDNVSVAVKMMSPTLNQEFLIFPTHDGATYQFRKTDAVSDRGSMVWTGETLGSEATLVVWLFEHQRSAILTIFSTESSTEITYNIQTDGSGLGILYKATAASPNLPRHPPGFKSKSGTRQPSGTCLPFFDLKVSRKFNTGRD